MTVTYLNVASKNPCAASKSRQLTRLVGLATVLVSKRARATITGRRGWYEQGAEDEPCGVRGDV